jgi:DNA-binding response OmpR family regulator
MLLYCRINDRFKERSPLHPAIWTREECVRRCICGNNTQRLIKAHHAKVYRGGEQGEIVANVFGAPDRVAKALRSAAHSGTRRVLRCTSCRAEPCTSPERCGADDCSSNGDEKELFHAPSYLLSLTILGAMNPRTILVVDDEPVIRSSIAEALSGEGYQVAEAVDGASALAAFRESKPNLVLLDVMLPGLSGIEICRIIRAESTTPIILLTARDAEADKVLGLEVGADDYVTKPFSLRELMARVRAVLRRLDEPQKVSDLLELNGVQVDLPGHRLLRNGVALPIKPQAFRLLTFLMENPGRVFSRNQLLEQVWGSDFPGETRTVDVHMHALRELIEEDPADPIVLQTIRGVGYVLRPIK